MLKLAVVTERTPSDQKEIAFRLESDGADVDIYANDDLIGWFEINEDGKIQFRPSYPCDTESFAVNEVGYLTAV